MIDTESSVYRMIVWAAVLTAVIVGASTIYQYAFTEDEPGELNYRQGNMRLEDGLFQKALVEFDSLLEKDPHHAAGYLGRGLTLIGLGDNAKALQAINRAIDIKPDFAAAYANRGIVYDKMGRPEQALQDYRKALRLDAELGEGPGWITRFFRKQAERPATIADRAVYLESELKKRPTQRLLQVPETDKEQRSYKIEGRLD